MPDIDQPKPGQCVNEFVAIDIFDDASLAFDKDALTHILGECPVGRRVHKDVLAASFS